MVSTPGKWPVSTYRRRITSSRRASRDGENPASSGLIGLSCSAGSAGDHRAPAAFYQLGRPLRSKGCRASLLPTVPAWKEIVMHLMYFTEQPMSAYSAKAGLDFGATALMFSNSHFDPAEGSRLYNEYLEHYIMCDELGFDGIMLNEHHNAPFCMQARANI